MKSKPVLFLRCVVRPAAAAAAEEAQDCAQIGKSAAAKDRALYLLWVREIWCCVVAIVCQRTFVAIP